MRTFHTKVVGVTYNNRQKAIRSLQEGDEIFLVREPSNPYDENAILVVSRKRGDIGHIPRELAAQIAPLMDAINGLGEGTVFRLTGGTQDYPTRGVEIFFSLPTPTSLSLRMLGQISLSSQDCSIGISGDDTLCVILERVRGESQLSILQCDPPKLLRDFRFEDFDLGPMVVSQTGDMAAILQTGNRAKDPGIHIVDTRQGVLAKKVEIPIVKQIYRNHQQRWLCFSEDDAVLFLAGRAKDKFLITGWETDSWKKVAESRMEWPAQDDNTMYPLVLDPDSQTILYKVEVDPDRGDSLLRWLYLATMLERQQLTLPYKVKKVMSAGRRRVAVLCKDEKKGLVIDTNDMKVIDTFNLHYADDFVYAVLAAAKLIVSSSLGGYEEEGGVSVCWDTLHMYEYNDSDVAPYRDRSRFKTSDLSCLLSLFSDECKKEEDEEVEPPIIRYLEGRIDWGLECVSPSGSVCVIKGYSGYGNDDPARLTVLKCSMLADGSAVSDAVSTVSPSYDDYSYNEWDDMGTADDLARDWGYGSWDAYLDTIE